MAESNLALVLTSIVSPFGADLLGQYQAKESEEALAELEKEAAEAELEYQEEEARLKEQEFQLTAARQRETLVERGEFNIGAATASHAGAGGLKGSQSVLQDITAREERLTEELEYMDTITDISQSRFDLLLGEGGYFEQQQDFLERGFELTMDTIQKNYLTSILGTVTDTAMSFIPGNIGGIGGGF